jgi:hypothetical protein
MLARSKAPCSCQSNPGCKEHYRCWFRHGGDLRHLNHHRGLNIIRQDVRDSRGKRQDIDALLCGESKR